VNDAIKKVNDQINIYEARNSKAEETIKVIKEEIQNLKNKSL
jgi:cell division protein FtsB